MATYKDTPLKQLVDDYNVLHADDVGFVQLTEDQCEITSVRAMPSTLDGGQNTSAILVITSPDANYSAPIPVRYRRLVLDTAYPSEKRAVVVYGPATQGSVDAATVYALLDASTELGIARLLTSPVAINFVDGAASHTITAPSDDPQFVGNVTITVALKQYDLATFDTTKVYKPFGTNNELVITNSTDVLQLVIDAVVAGNNSTAPSLPKISVSYDAVTYVKSDLNSAIANKITIAVIDSSSQFKGSNTFTYSTAFFPLVYSTSVQQAIDSGLVDQSVPAVLYTSESTLDEIIEPMATEHGLWLPELETMGLRPTPIQNNVMCYAWLKEVDLAYGSSLQFKTGVVDLLSGNVTMGADTDPGIIPAGSVYTQTIVPIAYEFDFTMTLSQDYEAQSFSIFTNSAYYKFPADYTMEIISAPDGAELFSEFYPVSPNGANGVLMNRAKMLTGDYRFKITATKEQTNNFGSNINANTGFQMPYNGPVVVHRHIAPFISVPLYTNNLTYDGGAFTGNDQCIKFTYVPEFNFVDADYNNLKRRCSSFADLIAATSSVTAVPVNLFEDIYVPQEDDSFTGIAEWMGSHPGLVVRNIPFMPVLGLFSGLQHAADPNIFKDVGLRNKVDRLSNLFSGIQSPAITGEMYKGWFDAFVSVPYRLIDLTGNGQIILESLFYYNTGISSIGGDFFDKLAGTGLTLNTTSLFQGSTISSVGAGIFDGLKVTTLNGMFQDCTLLTQVPDGLFANTTLSSTTTLVTAVFLGSGLTVAPINLFKLNPSVTSTVGIFYNTKLTSTPSDVYQAFPNLTSISTDFSYCANLVTISPTLLSGMSKLTDFESLFRTCRALENIPTGLMADLTNLITAQDSFSDCALTSIPADLFQSCTKLESSVGTFAGTLQQFTSLPSELYSACPALVDVTRAYVGCPMLSTIPANLFANNPLLHDASQLFQNCPALKTVPAELFANNDNLMYAVALFDGAGITSVPETLFSNTPTLQSLSTAFQGTSLATVPENLFSGLYTLIDIGSLFNSTPLVSIPNGLFASQNRLDSLSSTFANCTQLTTVPVGLFDALGTFLGSDVELNSVFNGCAALTTVPTGLFRNPNIAYANDVFTGSGLTSAPNLFTVAGSKAFSVDGVFNGCQNLTSYESGLFNNCQQLQDLDNVFYRCYKVDTVNPIIHYSTASSVSSVSIAGMLSTYGNALPLGSVTLSGPVVTTDKALLTVTDLGFGGPSPFDMLQNQAFNINQLLGANVRLSTNNPTFAGFVNMTGSGLDFIANNLSSGYQPTSLFYNCSSLSDYDSLPSWAK